MTLGEKIKTERLRKGLSQSELAGEKITRNMLSAIESDKANPSLSTLSYLAQRLSVSLSYLFSEQEDMPLQRKNAVISLIKNEFNAQNYKVCISEIEKLQFIDDELALMLAVCHFNLGRAAILCGAVSEAKEHLNQFKRYSSMTIYDTGVLESVYLIYTALASNLQSPLLNFKIKEFEDGLRREFDFELYKYMTHDSDYQYENTVFSRHLSAKEMIRQRRYKEAISLLQTIENEKSSDTYNAYVKFGIYNDLENCYKQLADFQNAYRYASKRLSLIEAFK